MATGIRRNYPLVVVLLVFWVGSLHAQSQANIPTPHRATLWVESSDIGSRDLINGSGGKVSEPKPPLVFIEEDRDGSNPKIDVRDQNGHKWTVKFGREAQPETVVTRLLWAVGFFTDVDYFVDNTTVENLPAKLRRGQNFIKTPGTLQDVRLKLSSTDLDKRGEWKWKKNPFSGTRELNGLRVMMVLVNNWDLKDENNDILYDKKTGQERYLVSDVGSSFGTTGHSWSPARQKGNLSSYRKSRFIKRVRADWVDFNVPTRPALINLFNPVFFVRMCKLRWIGKHIPRQDAKWMGQILAKLSPEQIRDAFRSGGYEPADVEGFSKVVEERIAQLQKL